jgi:hypothetical protein
MGFWLLVLAGAGVGWMLGGSGGSVVGVLVGIALAFGGHRLQRDAFLFGIHDAARLGNVARVGALLEKNASRVNSRDASGNTPLHCAIPGTDLGGGGGLEGTPEARMSRHAQRGDGHH